MKKYYVTGLAKHLYDNGKGEPFQAIIDLIDPLISHQLPCEVEDTGRKGDFDVPIVRFPDGNTCWLRWLQVGSSYDTKDLVS